jgi:phospholipid/cholesterol/gamma-HCH transport system substrate-binding protein
METKANYVLIGAFTLATAAFLLLFGLWAAKYSSDRDWQEYRVIFSEPVTGLTEGSSVQYNGIAVGTVETLALDAKDPRRVIARLKVKADVPVKVDTRAKISITGLTGVPFIQLTGGSPNSARLLPKDRDDIPVILTEASALQNIADTANRLVARMDEVLSPENVQRITDTLENIEGMTGALGDQREDLRLLVVNAREASEQLKATLVTTNGAIERIDQNLVRELPGLVDKLDRTLTQLESTSKNANALIAENRAPLASFAQDGLQQVGPTLTELRTLIRDLRRVASRLDGNPAGYVLGRQQPKEFEPK